MHLKWTFLSQAADLNAAHYLPIIPAKLFKLLQAAWGSAMNILFQVLPQFLYETD